MIHFFLRVSVSPCEKGCTLPEANLVGGYQKGVALVLVLWVIALLSVMALAAVSTSRTEVQLVRNRLDEARMRALAEAGVSMAVLRLRSAEEQDHWYPDGAPHSWWFAGHEIEVRLYNESSRLDINRAPELQLKKMIEAVAVEDVDTEALLASVLDWRDADQSARVQGAEDGDYRSEGLPYGAKDGAFDSVVEFGLVLGMPRELSRLLEPHLTVHSGSARVQMEYASPLVKDALGEEEPQQGMVSMWGAQGSGMAGEAEFDTRTLAGPLYRIRVSGEGPAVETLIRVGRRRDGGPFSTIGRRYDWREASAPVAEREALDTGAAQ